MIKRLLIVTTFVIVGLIAFGESLETTDNPSTIAKKAGEGMAIDALESSTKTATKQLGDMAIKTSCSKNPNSQMCYTTSWGVFITSLAVAILFLGLIAGVVFGGIKIILSVFQ